jgi:branched-chain amino acid transport system ATP-binding protein
VPKGERYAIIGPNGAGKSTLFNLISGRFGPPAGDMLLNGRSIDGKKPFEINRWACRAASRSPTSSPS